MVVPNADKKAIVEQCILGMNNPNKIMDVSYDESVRFFSCVLLAMNELDGYICREEMILGPMCVNDNSPEEFSKMISYIRGLRGNFTKLQSEVERLAKSLSGNKKEGMTVTSVQNCTRFPISVLKYCDWVESENTNLYGRSVRFMKLTEHGKKTVAQLKTMKDVRLEDYERCSSAQKRALIRLGAYQMLGRAKFDLSTVESEVKEAEENCKEILDGKNLLFSPYQTIEYSIANQALNITVERNNDTGDSADRVMPYIQAIEKKGVNTNQNVVVGKHTSIDRKYATKDTEEYIAHIKELYKTIKNIDKLVQTVVEEHKKDKKTEFYPLIETVFRIIGVDCHKSRDGVNGERWDAMIRDPKRSIPIEIKSPTEEEHISIKAIRQALENKIILLSRKTYITTDECSTYAVGYYPPNDRAEVADLIDSIKETYGYSIAVFDIGSLIKLTVNIILFGKGIDINKLYELEGIVNVTDIES